MKNIQEISNLIIIRQYVVNSVDNYNLDRAVIKELVPILNLLDKKITSMVLNDDFKDFVKLNVPIAAEPPVKSSIKK